MKDNDNAAPAVRSDALLAHCCLCHSTFPESEVIGFEHGGDECPKCHEQGFTICLDGEAQCACGDGANAKVSGAGTASAGLPGYALGNDGERT